MTAFHERSGLDRYGADALAGDLAERKVAQVLAAMNRPCVDFGPKRVSTERAQQTTWPEIIRYAPDYLGWNRFIECQGFGESRNIIFKEKKLDALIYWNGIMPVWFGLYDSVTDTVTFADLATILWAIHHEKTEVMILDAGSRGEKKAWSVPAELLLEREFNNAFEAERVARKGRKRGQSKDD